jgi:hypothetical protein
MRQRPPEEAAQRCARRACPPLSGLAYHSRIGTDGPGPARQAASCHAASATSAVLAGERRAVRRS